MCGVCFGAPVVEADGRAEIGGVGYVDYYVVLGAVAEGVADCVGGGADPVCCPGDCDERACFGVVEEWLDGDEDPVGYVAGVDGFDGAAVYGVADGGFYAVGADY